MLPSWSKFIFVSCVLAACSEPGTSESPDPTPDLGMSDMADMDPADTASDMDSCGTKLFGTPAPNTGLSSDQCGPTCGCPGLEKVGTIPTPEMIANVRSFELNASFEEILEDPYQMPAPDPAPEGTVCAALIEGTSYSLQTFSSAEDALTAGAIVTHFGACGACSPLQDLAVYMENPDLTTPVRECGLKSISDGEEAARQCIRDLGFTEPCAQIWFYNTRHTRQECLEPCLLNLNAPYHEDDGSLNECILCDEVKSGDVFKAVAGRTRRNTGLPSALCRPCEEVSVLEHQY